MNESKGFQAVIQHFKQNKLHFEADETRLLLHASFSMRHAQHRCVAAINRTDDLLQFLSILPVNAPPEKRPAMAEACIRASWGLGHGRFELNMEDGELHFHSSTPYRKGELTDDLIRRAIGTTLFTADAYFPAFMSVLYGGASPAEAVRQIEEPDPKSKGDIPPPEPPPPSRIRFN